jgi:hypothetical protein
MLKMEAVMINSRVRHLLCIIALLAGVEAVTQPKPTIKITNPVAGEGLRVIDATSPEFLPELNEMLSPQEIAKATPFLWTSVIVVNDSGRYIWGFTVIYTYPDLIAPSGNASRHIKSPSPGGAAARELMLPPGGRYLITPVSGFAGSKDASGRRMLAPNPDVEKEVAAFQSNHSNAKERIQISLDSVIFEDGTIEGPDEAGTQRKVNDRIRATNDFVASLENLRGDELRAKLSDLSTTVQKDEHSVHLGDLASMFQVALNNTGEDAVIQQLEKMKTERWFPDPGYIRRKAK